MTDSLPDEHREPYIPVRVVDLIDLLCGEAGTPDFPTPPADDQDAFRTFARALAARMHAGFRHLLNTLKDAYAPFDPDADTKRLRESTEGERHAALTAVTGTLADLLTAAGFHRMTRGEIETTMQGSSAWGIEMEVCWDVFDRVEVFYRGKGVGLRLRRVWWKLFRREEILLPTFRRVVILFKLRPHDRVDAAANTQDVYLQLFKDIPQMDIEMLLPGTRLRMPRLERGKLGGSAASGIGWIAFKLSGMWKAVTAGGLLGWYAPLILIGTYAYKTFISYRVAKRTYLFQLMQSLYYQNLDTNAGVLYRLFDDAEEQELRQALLAYFFLWRFHGPAGATLTELDRQIEADVEKRVGERIEVDTTAAISRLERYAVVRRLGERVVAVPVRQATSLLEYQAKAVRQTDRPSDWRGSPVPTEVAPRPAG